MRSYFARLLFALVPPEDEDEDGDEEGIAVPIQVAKGVVSAKPSYGIEITTRGPSHVIDTRSMRGSASRTAAWASLARSVTIDPARIITSAARASAPAHRREDASRRWIDRHRRHQHPRFSTVGEAFLVAAHAHVLRRAGAEIPAHLAQLLAVVTAEGASPLPPDARDGLHPLVLPIARAWRGDLDDDRVVGLLLRPSPSSRRAPLAGPLPVVLAGPGGVRMLAKDAASYVHAAIVREDASPASATMTPEPYPVAGAAGAAGRAMYTRGELAASSMPDRPEVFILRNVGKFPDDMEAMALRHLRGVEKGATPSDSAVTSALVTAEWYANDRAFEGWAGPQAFNARMLRAMGRADEARDAARVALSTASCWDTVGTERGGVKEMVAVAGLDAGMGARELREMLETGGEAHKAAAAAMAGRIPGADSGGDGEGPTAGEGIGGKETKETTRMRAASAALDAAALGSEADVAQDSGESWEDAREEVGSAYEEAGLAGLAAFVLRRGEMR